jgi:hypothetical protein
MQEAIAIPTMCPALRGSDRKTAQASPDFLLSALTAEAVKYVSRWDATQHGMSDPAPAAT